MEFDKNFFCFFILAIKCYTFNINDWHVNCIWLTISWLKARKMGSDGGDGGLGIPLQEGPVVWYSLQDGYGAGPQQNRHGADLHYKMVIVGAACRTDMVPISTTRWWLWEPLAGQTWCRSPLQDGDCGSPLQDGHGADLNYKIVVVVPPLQDGHVAELNCNMVLLDTYYGLSLQRPFLERWVTAAGSNNIYKMVVAVVWVVRCRAQFLEILTCVCGEDS